MALKITKTPGADDEFAKHLGATPVSAITSVHLKDSKGEQKLVTEKSETLHPGVMIPPDQLYLLRVEGGHTVNLGNFESAKIGVSLQVPAKKDELEDAYAWATEWIGEKIEAAISSAKG